MNSISVLEKDLIKVEVNDNQEAVVSGRELHRFLEIETPYKKWFDRMTEYGFIENTDFIVMDNFVQNLSGGRPGTDHIMKLDMAKELSMIQRTEKGKQARKYFIQVEKDFNSPEKVMARALLMANETISSLSTNIKIKDQQIAELKPKADYTDRILKSKSLVTTTQIAKDYGMSGTALNKTLHELRVQYKQSGQWLLYSKYQAKGYTHSETMEIKNSKGIPRTTMQTKWTQKGRLFIYNLLKEEGILPLIEKE